MTEEINLTLDNAKQIVDRTKEELNKKAGNEDLGELAFKDIAEGNYTPQGTLSPPTFTGIQATITMTGTPSGSVAKPSVQFVPTSKGYIMTTKAGTLPSLTYDSETNTVTFSAGTLPTTENKNILIGGGCQVNGNLTFTGNEMTLTTTVTPQGTVSPPTFTGVKEKITVYANLPIEKEWYVFNGADETVPTGLTIKLSDYSDYTSAVYDETYGWGQELYEFTPEEFPNGISSTLFSSFYDKGGSVAISGIPVAPFSCSVYFADGFDMVSTSESHSSNSILYGYPSLIKVRLPNDFTGMDRTGNASIKLFYGSPCVSSGFTSLVIPPNFKILDSNNTVDSFNMDIFPNFKKLYIQRANNESGEPLVINPDAFKGTAMWNTRNSSGYDSYDSIAEDFEIFLDITEQEFDAGNKISIYNYEDPYYRAGSFKQVFNYLRENGRVHFNQTIVNE